MLSVPISSQAATCHVCGGLKCHTGVFQQMLLENQQQIPVILAANEPNSLE